MHISRRSQRAFLSMLSMLFIIYHAVKQQEEVIFQQQVSLYQQNRTMPIARTMNTTSTVEVKAEMCGWGNDPLLLGLDAKHQGSHDTRTTSGQCRHELVEWTMPNITLRIYNPAAKQAQVNPTVQAHVNPANKAQVNPANTAQVNPAIQAQV
jgi:hypothetical protein